MSSMTPAANTTPVPVSGGSSTIVSSDTDEDRASNIGNGNNGVVADMEGKKSTSKDSVLEEGECTDSSVLRSTDDDSPATPLGPATSPPQRNGGEEPPELFKPSPPKKMKNAAAAGHSGLAARFLKSFKEKLKERRVSDNNNNNSNNNNSNKGSQEWPGRPPRQERPVLDGERHHREIADLEDAGWNPLKALKGGKEILEYMAGKFRNAVDANPMANLTFHG